MRPHRLAALEYRGPNLIFLTTCTFARHRYFEDGSLVDTVRGVFTAAASARHVEIVAYCFMPDHWHGLVRALSEPADIAMFIRIAKQRTAFAFRRRSGGRLWQESFFDRTLRRDTTAAQVIAYIIANPVRAGLVERVEDYPYWGSDVYERHDLIEFVQTEAVRPWSTPWRPDL